VDVIVLGPLPGSAESEATIAKHELALSRVQQPVTDEEASALAKCFGPDDCFGLAWTLIHLIETAPSGIPLRSAPNKDANEWLQRLWSRSHR
jgi:hypothetical protein